MSRVFATEIGDREVALAPVDGRDRRLWSATSHCFSYQPVRSDGARGSRTAWRAIARAPGPRDPRLRAGAAARSPRAPWYRRTRHRRIVGRLVVTALLLTSAASGPCTSGGAPGLTTCSCVSGVAAGVSFQSSRNASAGRDCAARLAPFERRHQREDQGRGL